MQVDAKIVGDTRLKAKLVNINRNLLTRKIMGRIAGNAVTNIKDRTLEGKDKNRRPFAGYSTTPGYFKLKGKSRFFSDGYSGFKRARGGKFATGKVNLFDGGDMFKSMQHQVRTSDTAEIIFTRSPQALKASGHHHGSTKTGLPKRQFFSLGREGEEQAAKLLKKHLGEVLGA